MDDPNVLEIWNLVFIQVRPRCSRVLRLKGVKLSSEAQSPEPRADPDSTLVFMQVRPWQDRVYNSCAQGL